MKDKKVRIAAMSDIHISDQSRGAYNELFEEISQKADILVLCGDLTNRGAISEAHILLEELKACKIPILTVLGNHDVEEGQEQIIKELLTQSRITVLDGDTFVFQDVGFAGVKGFGGGFERNMLGSWGEKTIKDFVREAVDQSILLENALGRLTTEKRAVIMHYSPIRETVVGENPEIFPFLGSTRLEDPLNRMNVNVVFHGHAHRGAPEGKTARGIPVFNVSFDLMKHHFPTTPYRIFEL